MQQLLFLLKSPRLPKLALNVESPHLPLEKVLQKLHEFVFVDFHTELRQRFCNPVHDGRDIHFPDIHLRIDDNAKTNSIRHFPKNLLGNVYNDFTQFLTAANNVTN
jgi:hypothetical protein